MTIFLEIAKKFLKKGITNITESSVAADASLGNSVASLFGYGRDADLSKEKREYAGQLLVDLHNMRDKDKDSSSREAIKVLIDGCKTKAMQASGDKNYNEGNFGPGMLAATTMVDDIYKKLAALTFLDIQHDDDPFNELRFKMAYYFSQKIFEGQDRSCFGILKSNPNFSDSIQVAKEKEELIIRNLLSCEKDLKTLDIEHCDYAITRKKRVLEWIKTMREENIGVCKDHTRIVTVPLITFSIFGKAEAKIPTLGPDAGFLEECLKDCVSTIVESMAVESREILAM